jgi:hypothetical protein
MITSWELYLWTRLDSINIALGIGSVFMFAMPTWYSGFNG